MRLLRSQKQTLLLATVNEDGSAEASVAPYLEQEGSFYIFVSELARHTRNMRQQSAATTLFIEDENEASNPFSRRRLSYRCRVTEVKREDANYALFLDLMEKRFGKLLQTLRQLPDFHLLQLQPQSGHYVSGFARAYTLNLSGSDGGIHPKTRSWTP
ncbi:MAG: pyridoxamine 5'-phosphate oxidase family protein [Gammaproteobacteria bacterium]|nr:pyridoxamine 5'-phosphate oxidase family protein [Gammaproteobacteria bacterium]